MLIWVFLLIFGLTTASMNTYTAAVVEYFPLKPGGTLSIVERIKYNVEQYIKILSKVNQNLDIIVYPESTLAHGAFPESREDFLTATTRVQDGDVPCETNKGYEDWLVNLSCAAKKFKTYLSVDLLEKTLCQEKCVGDGWEVYNTNVVFDRSGKIVSKYRKFNLFGEVGINKTDVPMRSKFSTDFGVTFGVLICFDILFEDPAMRLIEEGVKHFIFPSKWFSAVPFLTSLQVQQMWSYENDVVLLSAGANDPRQASGGSGIYQGKKGPLLRFFSGEEQSKVMIAQVEKVWDFKPTPIVEYVEDVDKFVLWKENMENYTLKPFDLKKRTYRIKLDNIKCDFKIFARALNLQGKETPYKYHLVAFRGLKSFSGYVLAEIQVCSLIACKGDDYKSCGIRMASRDAGFPYAFEKISVKMTLDDPGNSIQFPNSIVGDLLPMRSDEFLWKKQQLGGVGISRENVLAKARRNLLTFGVFGRGF